uniref:Rho-GAP domain-containing protein n=1 Tax=Trichuris muris TaxID=70415 RepID=A0A5S6QJA0_TRIMR
MGDIVSLRNLPFVECMFCDNLLAYAPEDLAVAFTDLTEEYLSSKDLCTTKPRRSLFDLSCLCSHVYDCGVQKSSTFTDKCRKVTDILDLLAEPIITNPVKESLLLAFNYGKKTRSERKLVQTLGTLCNELPQLNLQTLHFLVKGSNLLAKYARSGEVTTKKLGCKLARHIFGTERKAEGFMAALKAKRTEVMKEKVLTLLIEHPEVLYPTAHSVSSNSTENREVAAPLCSQENVGQGNASTWINPCASALDIPPTYAESVRSYSLPVEQKLRRKSCSLSLSELDTIRRQESLLRSSPADHYAKSDGHYTPSSWYSEITCTSETCSLIEGVIEDAEESVTFDEEPSAEDIPSMSLSSSAGSTDADSVGSFGEEGRELAQPDRLSSPTNSSVLRMGMSDESCHTLSPILDELSHSSGTAEKASNLGKAVPDLQCIPIGWVKQMILWFEMIVKSSSRC